ncbi:uncharacterized protein LOC116307159 [Actinia tenebrosa]|uniref:Uncharacterized protein LOC116307159 n=1 Tax=Actinia tenebrosa TaxID=6105 RepID=A0A6P8J107_ACTTE|nr:uncharacterized protein LOC116307159 [Actinia tenebrosa]
MGQLYTVNTRSRCSECVETGDNPPHRVINNGVYRFWSTVSRSNGCYLKRISANVKCDGTNDTADRQVTLVTAREHSTPTNKRFRFVMENPSSSTNEYVITGSDEGAEVYLQDVPKDSTPPKDEESLFEPEYYYSSTLFRCWNVNGRSDLYIGSQADGKVIMIKGGSEQYPNPEVLFRLVNSI